MQIYELFHTYQHGRGILTLADLLITFIEVFGLSSVLEYGFSHKMASAQ